MSLDKTLREFVHIRNLDDDDFCDRLIDEGDRTDGWRPHFWTYLDKGGTKEKDHDADVLWSNGKIAQEYHKRLVSLYEDIIVGQGDGVHGWAHVVQVSLPRFNRYSESSDMNVHIDHIKSLFGDNPHTCGIPVVSFVALLNDDFEGGQFMLNGEDMNLTKGDVICFPSLFMYPHEVSKITKGTRYSVVNWAW